MQKEKNFQVNLGGIIDLLSEHLYSGPQVFLRELLQNATDAIVARRALDPSHQGSIRIELHSDGDKPRMVFEDDGIGLRAEEVDRFLATIGASSKREALEARRDDFIGQFGIGLLSAFMVTEEIVMITRSAHGDEPALQWNGKAGGTYATKVLEGEFRPGTKVFLSARAGMEEYFHLERVASILEHYGALLPYPIFLEEGGETRHINAEGAPWREGAGSEELLAYGEKVFGIRFLDTIPLKLEGKLDGLAFVLPFSPSPAAKLAHRVYLKNMLISDSADSLLPEWAFFVRTTVNVNHLRPTASRESFYEDEMMQESREELGEVLREYLFRMAEEAPDKMKKIIAIHALALKALALHDPDCYRLFIDLMPFETSMGRMTLGEYRQRYDLVRFISDLDQFRQVSQVAAAQGQCIINAGYIYDDDLLRMLPRLIGVPSEEVDALEMSQDLEALSLEEREEVATFLRIAGKMLDAFGCEVLVKKFRPVELPTLLSMNTEMEFLRTANQSKEVADPLWSSMIDTVTDNYQRSAYSQLVFNYRNTLARKLFKLSEPEKLKPAVELLYVQSLLMGHHPVSAREMALLNHGLMDMLNLFVRG